jgi:hypothetical protein
MTVLLINDKIDSEFLVLQNAYKKNGYEVTAIHQLSNLKVSQVSNDQVDIFIDSKSIADFNVIHILNFPGYTKSYFSTSEEDRYKYNEYENIIMAGLSLLSNVKVINRGLILSSAKHIFAKHSFIKILHKLGWNIPAVETYYDFSSENFFEKIYNPFPDTEKLFSIILTEENSYFDTKTFKEEYSKDIYLTHVISKTQQYMRVVGIDICSIPITIVNGDYFAFGINYSLPSTIEEELAVKIIKKIL